MRKNRKTVSVITVVYNDNLFIENTIRSVLNQTYKQFQYIVIDGGSTDGTLEKIYKYKKMIDVVVSEPDKGIYDAMNKGIKKAIGEWTIFMNSGDQFYDNFVLEKFLKNDHEEDVIYGNYVKKNELERIIKPRDLNLFWKGLPFNHQSTFVRTELYRKFQFDLKYKVSSVHDFFFKLRKEGYCFKYLDITVAIYDMNGISATSFLWLIDNFRINLKYSKRKMHLVLGALVLHLISRIKRNFLKKII